MFSSHNRDFRRQTSLLPVRLVTARSLRTRHRAVVGLCDALHARPRPGSRWTRYLIRQRKRSCLCSRLCFAAFYEASGASARNSSRYRPLSIPIAPAWDTPHATRLPARCQIARAIPYKDYGRRLRLLQVCFQNNLANARSWRYRLVAKRGLGSPLVRVDSGKEGYRNAAVALGS